MNIKVCGITDIEQLAQLEKLEVDYAGLVFDHRSYQCIRNKISPEQIMELDLDLQLVGVFRDEPQDQILESIDDYALGVIQLNGNESPEFCLELSENVEVIKTFFLHPDKMEEIEQQLYEYDDAVDYYCFDIDKSLSGHPWKENFNWNLIADMSFEKPFFIGCGIIKPSDASIIHRFHHPDFFGVDINYHFEKSPGIKDTALILSFIRAINQVDN